MQLCRILGAILSLVLVCTVQAEQSIILGTGISMPPYVISDKDRGIAVDIFRAAMAEEDIKVDVGYSDNAVMLKSFNEKSLDAIFIANRETAPDAYFSKKPLVVFHNFAIALESTAANLKQIRDLRYYRVGAFRLANKLLPAPFAASVEKAPDYFEYTHQIEQVQDLFQQERDVLVMDQTIFRYYLSQLRRQAPESELYRQRFRYYDLFPRSRYFAVFHREDHRDAFDRGLEVIRKNGRYERILRTYQALLSDYLFR